MLSMQCCSCSGSTITFFTRGWIVCLDLVLWTSLTFNIITLKRSVYSFQPNNFSHSDWNSIGKISDEIFSVQWLNIHGILWPFIYEIRIFGQNFRPEIPIFVHNFGHDVRIFIQNFRQKLHFALDPIFCFTPPNTWQQGRKHGINLCLRCRNSISHLMPSRLWMLLTSRTCYLP